MTSSENSASAEVWSHHTILSTNSWPLLWEPIVERSHATWDLHYRELIQAPEGFLLLFCFKYTVDSVLQVCLLFTFCMIEKVLRGVHRGKTGPGLQACATKPYRSSYCKWLFPLTTSYSRSLKLMEFSNDNSREVYFLKSKIRIHEYFDSIIIRLEWWIEFKKLCHVFTSTELG